MVYMIYISCIQLIILSVFCLKLYVTHVSSNLFCDKLCCRLFTSKLKTASISLLLTVSGVGQSLVLPEGMKTYKYVWCYVQISLFSFPILFFFILLISHMTGSTHLFLYELSYDLLYILIGWIISNHKKTVYLNWPWNAADGGWCLSIKSRYTLLEVHLKYFNFKINK